MVGPFGERSRNDDGIELADGRFKSLYRSHRIETRCRMRVDVESGDFGFAGTEPFGYLLPDVARTDHSDFRPRDLPEVPVFQPLAGVLRVPEMRGAFVPFEKPE